MLTFLADRHLSTHIACLDPGVERRRLAGVVAVVVLALVIAAGTACSAPDAGSPTAPLGGAVESESARVERGAAADYRTLVCSAIHQVYGLGDVPGFARTLLRANYLWEGVLAARSKEALTPHFEYTAALLRVAGAIRGGNEEPDYARLSAAHTALNSADPHYVAVCKATGRMP